MRKTFLAGLVTLLPIAITFFISFFIIDFLTAPFVGIIENFIRDHGNRVLATHHQYLLLFASRFIILIIFLILILILGILTRKLFFSWLIRLMHRIFYKIPIIKTIYKITREISSTLFSERKKSLFKGTVAVPFPSDKSKALGLLSGDPPGKVSEKKEGLQTVFVPTSPHPISGFLMMYHTKEIQKTEIETEDLFKFLLSCGVFHPDKDKQ